MIGPIVIDDVDIRNDACFRVPQRKVAIGLDGRIHCVYLNWPVAKGDRHIGYAYSDDQGQTWTKEDPVPGAVGRLFLPSIVVDSSGNPHILYRTDASPYMHLEYATRVAGVWQPKEDVWVLFVLRTNPSPDYIVGETVQGQTSGAEAVCIYEGGFVLGVDNPYAGFQSGEIILGLTSGGSAEFGAPGGNGITSHCLAIDSQDNLHAAFTRGTRLFHSFRPSGGLWSHSDYMGFSPPEASHVAIAIDLTDRIHIAGERLSVYQYVNGTRNSMGAGSWNAPETFADGTTNDGLFSLAVDLQNDVHIALENTGLGGTNSDILNIHYYKRTAVGWATVEHVTDDDSGKVSPSIAVDKNGTVRVIFRGKGYGSYTSNEDIVMRTKLNGGDWGAVESITDREPTQYDPNMIHSLFPVSDSIRPNCPDGFALIWNGQNGSDTYTVEYSSEIIEALLLFPQMTLI